jgi:hypothetical protein
VRVRDPAHVREVASSISALGCYLPALIGKDNLLLNGGMGIEAARLLPPVCGSIICPSSSGHHGSPLTPPRKGRNWTR